MRPAIRISVVRLALAGLGLAAVCLASTAVPAATDGVVKDKTTFGLRGSGAIYVQMRSFMAPVLPRETSRSTRNAPVTVFLKIGSKDNVGRVCHLSPRIQEALLRDLQRNPVPAGLLFDPRKYDGETNLAYERSPEQEAAERRWREAVNRAIEARQVADVVIQLGTRRIGGGVMGRLPFSSASGCQELEGGT